MSGDQKKEKVLHTRISQSLDQEIRDKASNLGISVSNLVRNILLNTFGLVEDIVSDGANIARSARGESPASPRAGVPTDVAPRPQRLLGWQEMVLHINALCVTCNAIIARGDRGAIAITDGIGDKPMICLSCLKEIQDGTAEAPPV